MTKRVDKSSSKQAKPFLKWAGGKRQLLEQFEQFFPEEFQHLSLDHQCRQEAAREYGLPDDASWGEIFASI